MKKVQKEESLRRDKERLKAHKAKLRNKKRELSMRRRKKDLAVALVERGEGLVNAFLDHEADQLDLDHAQNAALMEVVVFIAGNLKRLDSDQDGFTGL